jgi:Ser/Thr protein kinase RdoA (MazF antagonist)
MKPFEELSYQGQIRRMRQLAQFALNDYDFAGARLKFLRQAGNTLFRVNQANPTPITKTDLYMPGQFLLRIHQPGYQAPAAVELELEWLSSMCQDADLPIPEPVWTLDGKLYTQVAIPGIPEKRTCSLLRWVKGRELRREEIQPHHYRALGGLVARLHNHAAHWQPPAGLSKRSYDWDGLFRKEVEDGTLTSEAWLLLPPEYIQPFEMIAYKVKQVMDEWGKGPDVYGLIHGDLGMGANVLFWKGDARIIDFDDSGFGYYLFDLSIILEDSQDHQIRPRFREALLDGYTRVRPVSVDQIRNLDLFLAAYAVYWSLYAVDAVQYHPEDREEIYERMARYFRLVEHYLANLPAGDASR